MVCTKKNGTIKKYKLKTKEASEDKQLIWNDSYFCQSLANLLTYSGGSDIDYGNSKYVVVDSGRHFRVAYSDDGLTWTSAATPSTYYNNSYHWQIVYGNNKFVAFGNGGDVITSSNGTSWSYQTTSSSKVYPQAMAYGDGIYIAMAEGGNIIRSTNITSWSPGGGFGSSDIWKGIVYGNGKFVAIGQNGYISTSISGLSWTTATQNSNLGENSWTDIAYDGECFIAIGKNGHTSISTDGIIWSVATQSNNLGSYDWNKITFNSNNNKFMVLSDASSSNRNRLAEGKRDYMIIQKTYTLARKKNGTTTRYI